MPKKIEDIVPSNRKSIRDIPVPIRRAQVEPQREEPMMRPASPIISPSPEPRFNYSTPLPREKSKKGFWLGAGAVVILVAFAFVSLKSGAVVSYKPKVYSVAFANEVISAGQNATTSVMAYSTIKLSQDKSAEVVASGEETVSLKAQGQIVVYNEQTSAQQLVKSTRFATPDGKIYRIEEDITVPANGSLEVKVVADTAGIEQNIGLADFTLPGLKGTPRFEKVFGRSKTPMTGGFVGVRKKVEQADLAKAKTALEELLRSELVAQAGTQVPPDFILFPNLVEVSYEVLLVENSGTNMAKVTVRGNLNAVIFKKNDLAQFLAIQKLGANNVGSEVTLLDTSKLNASLISGIPSSTSSSTLKVNFIGSTDIVAVTDEKALAQDLLGKPKVALMSIIEGYPSISEASAVVRPFWKSVFPTEETKIKIEARK